ncbi:hypothetical protein PG994_013838 [Apiospora phragmitis]|uniref:Uncharacterized protein n=1 Tax=Apiospora phragmitis TaxID=2905665 RepID=A0ABR1T2L7_9PEZI
MPPRGTYRSGRRPSRGGRQGQQRNRNPNDNNDGVQNSAACQAVAQPQKPGQYYGYPPYPHGYGPYGHPYDGGYGYGYAQPPWGYGQPPPPAMQENPNGQALVFAPPPPPAMQMHPYGQAPAYAHSPQSAAEVTNPYKDTDPRYAEWEQNRPFSFGQGQSTGSKPALSKTKPKTAKNKPRADRDDIGDYDMNKLPAASPPELCRGPLDPIGRLPGCTFCGSQKHIIDVCTRLKQQRERSQWILYLAWKSRQGLAPLRILQDYSGEVAGDDVKRPVLNPVLAKVWEREVVCLDQAAKRDPYWKRFEWNINTTMPLGNVEVDLLPVGPTIPPNVVNKGPPSWYQAYRKDPMPDHGYFAVDPLDKYHKYDERWVVFENSERVPADTEKSCAKSFPMFQDSVLTSVVVKAEKRRDRDDDQEMPDRQDLAAKKHLFSRAPVTTSVTHQTRWHVTKTVANAATPDFVLLVIFWRDGFEWAVDRLVRDQINANQCKSELQDLFLSRYIEMGELDEDFKVSMSLLQALVTRTFKLIALDEDRIVQEMKPRLVEQAEKAIAKKGKKDQEPPRPAEEQLFKYETSPENEDSHTEGNPSKDEKPDVVEEAGETAQPAATNESPEASGAPTSTEDTSGDTQREGGEDSNEAVNT